MQEKSRNNARTILFTILAVVPNQFEEWFRQGLGFGRKNNQNTDWIAKGKKNPKQTIAIWKKLQQDWEDV